MLGAIVFHSQRGNLACSFRIQKYDRASIGERIQCAMHDTDGGDLFVSQEDVFSRSKSKENSTISAGRRETSSRQKEQNEMQQVSESWSRLTQSEVASVRDSRIQNCLQVKSKKIRGAKTFRDMTPRLQLLIYTYLGDPEPEKA